MDGIYTLANDVVYDQLIALLNSIEANATETIPVCVIPYDDRCEKVKQEVASRHHVTFFDNLDSINFWEDVATQAWTSHQKAQTAWKLKGWKPLHYFLGMHRKFCTFDGPFERFIYFDADTLFMGSLEPIYNKLNDYDWVVHDFQYKSDWNYVFDFSREQLLERFNLEVSISQIFCSGLFASKKSILNRENVTPLLQKLTQGESAVMSLRGGDQPLFNYFVIRLGLSFYNFAYDQPDITPGNHWSSQFEEVDYRLYDQGRRLTYLHYMSISSQQFQQLCLGKDVGIPYQEVFLHYRYLGRPDQRLQLKPVSFLSKIKEKIKLWLKQKTGNLQYKINQWKFRKKSN